MILYSGSLVEPFRIGGFLNLSGYLMMKIEGLTVLPIETLGTKRIFLP